MGQSTQPPPQPPAANKTNVDTVVSILSLSELLLCRVYKVQEENYKRYIM
jgi:hypothetical protein